MLVGVSYGGHPMHLVCCGVRTCLQSKQSCLNGTSERRLHMQIKLGLNTTRGRLQFNLVGSPDCQEEVFFLKRKINQKRSVAIRVIETDIGLWFYLMRLFVSPSFFYD